MVEGTDDTERRQRRLSLGKTIGGSTAPPLPLPRPSSSFSSLIKYTATKSVRALTKTELMQPQRSKATRAWNDRSVHVRIHRRVFYELVHLYADSWRRESGPPHPRDSSSEPGSSICAVDHVLDDHGKAVRRGPRNSGRRPCTRLPQML